MSVQEPEAMEEGKNNAQTIEEELRELRDKVHHEEQKHRLWKEENIRRRHNYIPFLMQLLKILAENNVLNNLAEAAIKKSTKKRL